jgi:acetyltransferase-like isoleucine patch superfamily enzyme
LPTSALIQRKQEFRPSLLGGGATIGAKATNFCGHVIGQDASLGAGAVVTADVPAFALMGGVPATRIDRIAGRAGMSAAQTSSAPDPNAAMARLRPTCWRNAFDPLH